MSEPGLDLHGWESEWSALEEELADAPAETLPEIDRLIERVLRERGYAIDDAVADDGVDPEILKTFREAHRIATAIDQGEAADPGDVAAAIESYRLLYSTLVSERSAP